MPSDSGDALGEPEAKKLEFGSASPRVESVTAGGEHPQSGKEKSAGPPELPLTVSGLTCKNDPRMSEDKLKELQDSISKTKTDQKAEKKADKKAEKAAKGAAKNEKEQKNTRMTAKAKSKPKKAAKAAASKKAEDEETDTLESEEPLTENEDESEPEEAEDKVGFLGCLIRKKKHLIMIF